MDKLHAKVKITALERIVFLLNKKLRQDLKTSKANNEALIGQLIDSIEKNRIKRNLL